MEIYNGDDFEPSTKQFYKRYVESNNKRQWHQQNAK